MTISMNYSVCLLFLEDEKEKLFFNSKWKAISKFFKVYSKLVAQNKRLLLYFNDLRTRLLSKMEKFIEKSKVQDSKSFDNDSISDHSTEDTDFEVFVEALSKNLLLKLEKDFARFKLFDSFFIMLNKDIYTRLKAYLKKKYKKSSLSDFLRLKVKILVVNLILSCFLESLFNPQDFDPTKKLISKQRYIFFLIIIGHLFLKKLDFHTIFNSKDINFV